MAAAHVTKIYTKTNEAKRANLLRTMSSTARELKSVPHVASLELAKFEVRFGYDDEARQNGNELLRLHSSDGNLFGWHRSHITTLGPLPASTNPKHPLIRLPAPGSHTAVPPWTRGGQSSLGALNCGAPVRRLLQTPGISTAAKQQRRAEQRARDASAVAQWRTEQRQSGEAWLEESQWYSRAENPPLSYLERTGEQAARTAAAAHRY